MRRTVYEPEHEQFREVVREFLAREVAPHAQAWEKAGIVDRHVYQSAGKHGVIGFNVPEEFGGGGVDDFRFNAVVAEELAKAGPGTPAFTLHSDVVAPYLTSLSTREQKQRWLPGFAAGELIGAIAMSEPGAGSDLAGIRTRAEADGDTWVLSGAKTFISVRDQLRPGHRGGQDQRQPDPRAPGVQPAGGGARHARLHPRPEPGQGGPEVPGHRGAVLRPGPGARGQRARRGRAWLLPSDAQPARGAAVDRRQRRRRGAGDLHRARSSTRRTGPRSASRSARSSTTGSFWPSSTPSWTSPRSSWTAAWKP